MDEEKKRRILHLTCCLLPKCHRDTMEILFSFLNWAASFSHIDEESGSKMDVHNLSTVVTPNILYSQKKEAGMDDSFLAIEAIHTLIACNETMCEVRWKFIGVVVRVLTCLSNRFLRIYCRYLMTLIFLQTVPTLQLRTSSSDMGILSIDPLLGELLRPRSLHHDLKRVGPQQPPSSIV